MRVEVEPGEPLMVSSPVARVTAAAGTEVRPEHLVQELKSKALSPAERCRVAEGSLLYRWPYLIAFPITYAAWSAA